MKIINIYGTGFEILILSIKYKETSNIELNTAKLLATTRNGQIIYV